MITMSTTDRKWTPETHAKHAARAAERRAARIENIEWILQFDNNTTEAVKRAGFTNVPSASRYLTRAGRGDLAALITRYGNPEMDVYHPDYGNPDAGKAALAAQGRAA